MIKGIVDKLLGDRSDAREAAASQHALTRSDDELLAAYNTTNGEPGDPEADALDAEIERRGLDD